LHEPGAGRGPGFLFVQWLLSRLGETSDIAEELLND